MSGYELTELPLIANKSNEFVLIELLVFNAIEEEDEGVMEACVAKEVSVANDSGVAVRDDCAIAEAIPLSYDMEL